MFELERVLPIPTCYATSQCKEDSALKVNKKVQNKKRGNRVKRGWRALRILTLGFPGQCGTRYSAPSPTALRER